jgi:hypothetical protein
MGQPPDKVKEFAEELERWAGKDRERETLVKWLLTRTVSHRFEGTRGKFVIERMDINKFNIQKAVMRAMTDCKLNPGSSTTGWVRGGPTWPRAYAGGWLKAYGC